VDSFPDIGAMTKPQLATFWTSLRKDDAPSTDDLDDPSGAYRRRVLRGKLSVVDAELGRRLRENPGQDEA
jgi:hypothetical protein